MRSVLDKDLKEVRVSCSFMGVGWRWERILGRRDSMCKDPERWELAWLQKVLEPRWVSQED